MRNDILLDVPFSAEEVTNTVCKLKPEGESLVIWLRNILEVVPDILKRSLGMGGEWVKIP